ncbi:MAG: LapA family protein [Rhodobacteraceae bacterium]|nr:LapA family protein [Paracoccaceae bacterium]
MRYLRLLVIGLLALSLLTVALANRTLVQVRLLPEDLAALTGLTWAAEVPLFLVIFAGIVAGVLIGFVWEWLRETGIRSTASARAREVARLEREIAELRGAAGVAPKDDVLALLEKR